MATHVPVTLDTLIVVKLQFQNNTRKFKIPLRDLGAQVLPEKLRLLLDVPANQQVVFERYSDSAGSYVVLDASKPQVYKTLFRAAKAKLKLRLRATLPHQDVQPLPIAPPAAVQGSFSSFSSSNDSLMETLSAQRPTQLSPVIARSPFSFALPLTENKTTLSVGTSPLSRLPSTAVTADSQIHGLCSGLSAASRHATVAVRPKIETVKSSWVVYCNNCNLALENQHYHCSICDHGDYDLCLNCVDSGTHCPGVDHWMVKRFVKDGNVVNNINECASPKARIQPLPGIFCEEKQPVVEAAAEIHKEPTRTCNCCVRILPERAFVTCTTCDDYDLCQVCHVANKHGHHPGHAFKAAANDIIMTPMADFLCNAGRNVRHSAVCDGCEEFIYGVRHKCLSCPDWDFCTECVKKSKWSHPGHRFVPIYEPLTEPVNTGNRHLGIYCDGPLCKDKNVSYIEGIRYKCAVCHDTDFCANCEAHPSNSHNHTHPLIKFKRPVRSVSVTTMNEDTNGRLIAKVGDRNSLCRSTATETNPSTHSVDADAQVYIPFSVKRSEELSFKLEEQTLPIRNLLPGPMMRKVSISNMLAPAETELVPSITAENKSSDDLDAHFVRDTVADGSKICAGNDFIQVWTLRNPGPNTWPAGCVVRFVGGDNMLNIDNTRPLGQDDLARASESNAIHDNLPPGKEVSLRVLLKAPEREGTAISYWRLKTADGVPFGHRLWCDIQVVCVPKPVSSVADVLAFHDESAVPSLITLPFTNQERAMRARMGQRWATQTVHTENPKSGTNHCMNNASVSPEHCQVKTKYQEELAKKNSLQEIRKAAVERLFETGRKDHGYSASPKQVVAQMKTMNSENLSAGKAFAELPVQEQVSEIDQKQTDTPITTQIADESMPQMSRSQSLRMIIPQLEKESPATSTHEGIIASSEDTSVPIVAADQLEEDFFEDAESVELQSLASDDGFRTDEEYDVLDASVKECM